jgi:hypothetical protein
VFIPRKIGDSIKVTEDIITAVLFPPSRMVNNPIIKTIIEVTTAGIILITNIESPKRDCQIASIQIEKGG